MLKLFVREKFDYKCYTDDLGKFNLIKGAVEEQFNVTVENVKPIFDEKLISGLNFTTSKQVDTTQFQKRKPQHENVVPKEINLQPIQVQEIISKKEEETKPTNNLSEEIHIKFNQIKLHNVRGLKTPMKIIVTHIAHFAPKNSWSKNIFLKGNLEDPLKNIFRKPYGYYGQNSKTIQK